MIPLTRLCTLSIVATLLATVAAANGAPAAGKKTLSTLLPGHAPSLPAGIRGDDAVTAFKVGRDLALLAAEHNLSRRNPAAQQFVPSNPLLRLRSGELVLIDAVSDSDTESLRKALLAIGLQNAATYGRIISGYLPIAAIAQLPLLNDLRFARPSYSATGAGSVDSQGDAAMGSDLSRTDFAVDGSGVTVGTLSDSFDCLAGAVGDVGTGDLPAGIVVIDDTACAASDEGRAMMQIVADVAPGAAQGFHTASGGQADFALGIEELAGCPPGSAAGCTPVPGFAADIINDDVFDPREPFFQDGVIAQAVENVVANGVSYFTLAGNHNRKSYEGPFVPSGEFEDTQGGELHDFDPGVGVDTMQSITVPVGATLTVSFQWDQPYFSVSGAPGSASDHDFFLFDAAVELDRTFCFGCDDNLGADPIEVFTFTNDGLIDVDGVPGPDTTFNMAISNFDGPHASTLKYIALVNGAVGDFTVNEYDTASGTIFGHMNAASAVTVGAAPWHKTPAFGTTPALPEPFTSAGPMPILFDGGGSPVFEPRAKPDLVAPDAGNNTFFGSDIPEDPDTSPNYSGTSAATAHAAGAAALVLETANLTPAGMKQTMLATAAMFDMGPAGFDDDTGHGFLMLVPLLDSTVAPASWTGSCGLSDYSLNGVPNDGPQTFRATTSITWDDGTFDGVTGMAPTHIFADGFESGDASSWGTCVSSGE